MVLKIIFVGLLILVEFFVVKIICLMVSEGVVVGVVYFVVVDFFVVLSYFELSGI